MVVHNLDVHRTRGPPLEADTVLVIDPNTMLPRAVSSQALEVVPWRHEQVIEGSRRVQYPQFPACGYFDRLEAADPKPLKEYFRVLGLERPNQPAPL